MKKKTTNQHTILLWQWPVITKWSSAQLTDALVELHTQSSVLNPRPVELMQVAIQEHSLKFPNSLHQCIAPRNPNWTKITQIPACQGMPSVWHGWSLKEGRWQFGLVTNNQDNWALLKGITQSPPFHCFLWAEFEFLSISIISWELLPPRCSPCFMKNKTKNPKQKQNKKKAKTKTE